MSHQFSQCANLSDSVTSLLNLLKLSPTLSQNTTAIKASLRKAIAPKFEIVFAGAFSAGKYKIIN